MSEANYPEVQLQEKIWEHIWWAETFTPLETHEVEYISLKLEAPLYIEGVIASIQYTFAGAPTGIDLATAKTSWVILDKYPKNKTILFRFRPTFRLVAGIEYAIVIRTIPMFELRWCWFTYEAPPGHYPRGKLIKSENSGMDWDLTDRGDMFFAEWGDPPVKPSPVDPPLINFATIDLVYFHQDIGLIMKLATNVPCHLTCYYTDKKPLKHHRSRTIRGLQVPWGTYFCFVAWNEIEQEEYGSTLYHTFIFPEWEECQTKWFTFKGEVDLIDSPSVGPVFEHHHSGLGPPQTEEQPLYNTAQGVGYGYYFGLGQKIPIANRTISKLGFWLSRRGTGGPGTVSFKIIQWSDKSVLASKDWGPATNLPLVPTYEEVTLDSPIYINEDVILAVWNIGGDTNNCAVGHYQNSDVKPNEYWMHFAAAWVEYPVYDCAYRYTFHQ